MKIKIEFHYTYLIMLLGFVLTGSFRNIIILTSIILIHELGHYLASIITNIKVDKIIIYPYGGLTRINDKINISINRELLVSISGIIFQSIYYYIIINMNIFRTSTIELFNLYHYSILYFNILPIYPLDGSKIIDLLLSKIIPYRISNIITIIISIIMIIIISSINIFITYNYTYIIILFILSYDIYKFIRELDYLYNRFLLERYLYNIKYKKISIIKNKNNMFKNRSHIINNKKEELVLKKMFDNR